jgi:hypothetical protein
MASSIDDEWRSYLSIHEQTNIGRIVSSIEKETVKQNNSNAEYANKTCVSKYEALFAEPEPGSPAGLCKPAVGETGGGIAPAAGEGSAETAEPYKLNISTKTKILYLNQPVDIHSIFWKINTLEYWRPDEGVVKKQIKIVSKTPEEHDEYSKKLESVSYYTENVIKHINNPLARTIKFKHEVKLTVGISKKDIINCRGKVKHAFYNCFAIIIRIRYEAAFREIHVKVFNTGKMEIPGVINTKLLDIIKRKTIEVMQPFVESRLEYIDNEHNDNVLINSNFSCGYFINREALHYILRTKYGIEAAFDPCSYPGVKCKFYFNNEVKDTRDQTGQIMQEDMGLKMSELNTTKKYTEVSFMIFRTGSCLIVGNCSEEVLLFVFEFIKVILINQKKNISIRNDGVVAKQKTTKMRKKNIRVSKTHFDAISAA